jgi:hypothetical protein
MAANNYWEGERIRLRAVEPEDQPFFQSFDQDTEATLNSWLIPFPRSQAADKQWLEKTALENGQNDEYRFTMKVACAA